MYYICYLLNSNNIIRIKDLISIIGAKLNPILIKLNKEYNPSDIIFNFCTIKPKYIIVYLCIHIEGSSYSNSNGFNSSYF